VLDEQKSTMTTGMKIAYTLVCKSTERVVGMKHDVVGLERVGDCYRLRCSCGWSVGYAEDSEINNFVHAMRAYYTHCTKSGVVIEVSRRSFWEMVHSVMMRKRGCGGTSVAVGGKLDVFVSGNEEQHEE